jgi:hypothetical protein
LVCSNLLRPVESVVEEREGCGIGGIKGGKGVRGIKGVKEI